VIPKVADLVTGQIEFHMGGNAHVLSEREGQADLFIAAENTATALTGDRVVARIMHEGVRQRRAQGAQTQGRVIRILERANKAIVGTLQRTKQFYFVIPDDPRFQHNIYVNPPQPRSREGVAKWEGEAPSEPVGKTAVRMPPPAVGDKVVVRLEEWESRHVNPEGEIIEVLGPAHAPGVDMLSIIRKHGLPTSFPLAVIHEADQIETAISEEEIQGREDLRAMEILTIDPDDARDFDDAIHVERLAKGWRLGVHIADVSHYVRVGSAMDKEALQRGNSVYLADRVIPMLPERLSNGICSLRPDEERLAFSVFLEFDRAGKVVKTRFAKAVIKSVARLTYKQAYAILQGKAVEHLASRITKPALAQRLHAAWELASLLRKNRFALGSLDLDFPEVKVRLDDKGRAIGIERIENDISHQLIEEFMLAANEAVAKETRHRLSPSIYRIHEKPEPEKLSDFREFASGYDYRVGDLTHRPEVQKFLKSIQGTPEEYALKVAFLKSLKRAAYAVNPLGHYGLAKENYTHFTSPIRRYADLVVHRVLFALSKPQGKAAPRPTSRDLPGVAAAISQTERTAAAAELESVKLKKIEFFQTQLGPKKRQKFKAIVLDVRSYGLLVELPEYLQTGLVHVSELKDDFYRFDPGRLRFIGGRTRKTYKLGDTLEVRVSRVDPFKQQIDFSPV
jgi:ribonuclease R